MASNGSLFRPAEKGLRKTNQYLESGAETAIIFLMALMVGLIFLQVFCRYVLNSSFTWAEELVLILLIWLTFLGSVVVARKGQWITIDVLSPFLPKGVRDQLIIFCNTASILFCLVLLREGIRLIDLQKGMMTSALGIAWTWVYISIPISSVMLCLQILEDSIKKIKENPRTLAAVFSCGIVMLILLVILPPFRPYINLPLFLLFTMLCLFLTGLPVAIALGLAAMVFFLTKGDALFVSIPQNMIVGVNTFALIAVPFFMLAGELMDKGGVTVKLVQFASALVGHIRGGLGHVAVVANLVMAGMSGSEVADATATGSVLIPSMVKKGYPPAFSAGIIASASVIGPIFPPSIPFVIYGALASTSVLKLFLGGAVPGVIMALFLMGAVYLVAKKKGYGKEKRTDFKSLLSIIKRFLLVLLMPFIVIGGMLAGVFTPTEASDIAVIYAFLLGVVVYREIKGKQLLEALSKTAVMTSGIMYIVATATAIGWIAAREQIPQALMHFLFSFGKNPWVVLTIINVILLVLGCFITATPILLIMIPILVPIIRELHIDPVHFGVMLCLNVMMGLNTPPFGVAMFITCKIAGVSIINFTRHWWPFFIALLLVLALVTYVPVVVTWLPNFLVK